MFAKASLSIPMISLLLISTSCLAGGPSCPKLDGTYSKSLDLPSIGIYLTDFVKIKQTGCASIEITTWETGNAPLRFPVMSDRYYTDAKSHSISSGAGGYSAWSGKILSESEMPHGVYARAQYIGEKLVVVEHTPLPHGNPGAACSEDLEVNAVDCKVKTQEYTVSDGILNLVERSSDQVFKGENSLYRRVQQNK